MKKKIIHVLILSLIISLSCSTSDNQSDISDEFDIPDSLFEEKPLQLSEEALGNIIQNLSSPIEMAALVKDCGVPFSKKYLCSTSYIDDYNTNFKKALGLGVLGADLGYLNIYNNTSSMLDYITSIKQLADDIKVGQFFNFETLKQFATNNENLDSLMYMSVSSFNKMDTYLRDNNRSNISTLILTGVWIEGLYLATQVVKEKHNDRIAERIGEQKIILNDLILILKNYKSDKKFSELISEIELVKEEFDKVIITYEIGEPESIEKDGMLIIIQNEKSIVDISKEQLNNIIEKTEKIRNNIIQS